MSSNNMYRVGDFVFFEASATAPYQIRRIDELNKTPTGAVEAKVTCYYRRREISSTLIQQAEKYNFQENDLDSPINTTTTPDSNGTQHPSSILTDLQRHQIKHRELFLSRQLECLPATHIRGKCSVTLYNEVEPLTSYVTREDAFYYRLIYDPSTKRLQEDRGSMRIGSAYQSDIQPLLAKGEKDPRFKQELETIKWNPLLAPSPSEIEMFVSLTKAVGLYARACDPANTQPLLLNAAAASSRDITLQHAHDLLFHAGYDVKKAMSLLVPNGEPTLCRDELEAWSASEAALFEEALEKYSKFFPDILTDFLPWKTPKSIVELYYFWKTTDRYIRHRRNKMAAQEHKLKQVYIPNYSKPNSAVLYNKTDCNDRGCECCYAETSPQWYSWGPPNVMCRLCSSCWTYWKKYGGLKNPDKRGGAMNSRPSPEQREKDRLEAAKASAKQATASGISVTAPTIGSSQAAVSLNNTHNILENTVDHRSAPSHHPLSESSLSSVVYRCNQPDCVKEFRSPDNLTTHLAQVHSVFGVPVNNMTTSNPVFIGLDGAIAPTASPLSGSAGVLNTTGMLHTSGTQILYTSPTMRIVRTLCPFLLRPFVLARCPTRHANATAKKQLAQSTVEPLIPNDELILRLKALSKSRIPGLRDPLAVLHRKVPTRSVEAAVRKVKKLKSIVSSALNVTSSIGEPTTPPASEATENNGKHVSLKRSLAAAEMNGEAINGSQDSSNSPTSDAPLEKKQILESPQPQSAISSTNGSSNGSHAE